jgi:glutamate-1-semialdehyde aminotransferase
LGVPPDLTTMGKIIGGLPVGAFGGRAEVIGERLAGGPHVGRKARLYTVVNGCGSLMHANFRTRGEVRKRPEPGRSGGDHVPSRP